MNTQVKKHQLNVKKTVLWLLFLIPFSLLGQSESFVLTGVVEVPGQTKEQIFIAARQWVVKSFNDSKEVIQLADKETGEISTKGILPFRMKFSGLKSLYDMRCKFRISIWIKDGKYKYEFSDFEDVRLDEGSQRNTLYYSRIWRSDEPLENNIAMQGKKRNSDTYKTVKETVISYVNALIEDLKKSVSTKPAADF